MSNLYIEKGVPAFTYVRIIPDFDDSSRLDHRILSDHNSVVLPSQDIYKASRHDVSKLFDITLNDEQVCDQLFGYHPSSNRLLHQELLNPIKSFIIDAVTVVIFVIG